MPAHPSNPDGHYEDLDVVALHQNALDDNQRDWFSLGGAVQPTPQTYDPQAQRIVERLNSTGNDWGFKDPRACLFLDWWFEQLTKPVGVFVYRHYLACNRSLRVREAQELTFSAHPDSVDLRFWKDPHHGLRLWADYNRCLLSFAEQHKAAAVVVSYDALMSGFNVVDAVNQAFDTSFNAQADSGIRTGASGLKTADRELPDIPADLHDELESILSGLDALSGGSVGVTSFEQRDDNASVDSIPVKEQSDSENTGSASLKQALKIAGLLGSDEGSYEGSNDESNDGPNVEPHSHLKNARTKPDGQNTGSPHGASDVHDAHAVFDDNFSDWGVEKIVEELDAAIGSFKNDQAMRIADEFEHAHLDHVKLQVLLAQICLRQGELARTEVHLQRVNALNPTHRTGLVLQGMLAERYHRFEEALEFFDQVRQEAPNNVGAYLHSARCMLGLKRAADALETAEIGIKINPDLLGLQLCKLDAMKVLSPAHEMWDHFETLLAEHPKNAALLTRYSHWLAEAGESSASREAYYKAVRITISSNAGYADALLQSLNQIEPELERRRLCHYVGKELEKFSSGA